MIFSNPVNQSSSANQPSRLRYESQDFNFTESLLENSIMLEDTFLDITNQHMMATYLSLKEDDMEILEEGFKDFTKSAVKFFEKMIRKFTEFMSKAFMVIRAYVGNFEKFLAKYKNKLMELNPDFNIMGYQYSFNRDLPRLDKIQQVVQSYNSELQEIKKMKKEEIVKQRNEFIATEQMNQIRAYVIGASRPIEDDEFIEMTRQSYRSYMDIEEEINITKTELMRILDGYKDLKQSLNDVTKEKNKTILIIESMKNFFSKGPSVHFDNKQKVVYLHQMDINEKGNGLTRTGTVKVPQAENQMDLLNTFYNFKWIQSKNLGSICITAVSEKINAIKEALKFYEKVIRKSLFNNQEEGSVSSNGLHDGDTKLSSTN